MKVSEKEIHTWRQWRKGSSRPAPTVMGDLMLAILMFVQQQEERRRQDDERQTREEKERRRQYEKRHHQDEEREVKMTNVVL